MSGCYNNKEIGKILVLSINIELGSKDIINKVGTEEEISLAVRRTH